LGANSIVQKPVVYREYAATVRDLGRYWLGVNQTIQAPSSVS
jgi:hypothetical protein